MADRRHNAESLVRLACLHCCELFDQPPKRVGRFTRLCSPACKRARNAALTSESKARLSSGVRRNAAWTDQRRPRARAAVLCAHCGGRAIRGFSPQLKYCSVECSIAANEARRRSIRWAARPPKPCKACGVVFDHWRVGLLYCSKTCLDRVEQSKRNAMRRKATIEPLDPFAVFNRDGWRCQICGVKTPKNLRGTYGPRAPELDHILPLSKGGEHSYRNTQLACRQCNRMKGATPFGQLNLFCEEV